MKILFLGSGDIGIPTLRYLAARPDVELAAVIAQPDKPAGRGHRLTPPPTKMVAAELGIPVLQPARIRTEDARAQIQSLAPDLAVVMAYGQILPRSVLEIPRLGCVNLHASLLPRHRGASPIQAAILAGDSHSGITLMQMDEGMDTGAILLKKSLPLSPRETGASLHDRLADLAPEITAEFLDRIAAGDPPSPIPQDPTLATHAPKIHRHDGWIDWTQPAVEIDRKVRAYFSWPMACTFLPIQGGENALVKIHSAETAEESSSTAPGTLIEAAPEGLVVQTGRGILRILTLQLPGKKPFTAREFLNGHHPDPSRPLGGENPFL